ncbi:MAG: hypothetical protein RL367_451, partial [Pseudomonadota bacterium]
MVALAAFASPVPALAQIAPGLTITPSVRLAFDDNIFRADGVLRPVDSDMIVSPALGIKLEKTAGRIATTIQASLGHDFYQRHTGRNRDRFSIGTATKIAFGAHCTLSPGSSLSHEQADYGDLLVPVTNIRLVTRETLELGCVR